MIFVTVGTQFFDELIDEVDRLVGQGIIREDVLAQIGLNKRQPKHIQYVLFTEELAGYCRQANMIITHAGTGSLCECISLGKPFIAVANQTKAGNHQLEFLEHLSNVYDFCWVASPTELASALPHARPAVPRGESGIGQLAEDFRSFCKGPAIASPAPAARQ
jgi:beta-1,4-N-acetylglucosaminyltransferase